MCGNVNFPNDINRTIQDISKSLQIISKYYLSLLEKERNEIEERKFLWTDSEREKFRNIIEDV